MPLSHKKKNCSCHDLLQKAMNFNDVAIVSIEGSDYRIHIQYLSKEDAIRIMNSYNLNEKKGIIILFCTINKSEQENLLSKKQRSDTKQIQRVLQEMTRKRLNQQSRNKYRELSEEENNIK